MGFLDNSGDIILDVVAATEAGEVVVLDGENGHDLWSFKPAIIPDLLYPSERSFLASPSLIDINKDSFKDILIGKDVYKSNM